MKKFFLKHEKKFIALEMELIAASSAFFVVAVSDHDIRCLLAGIVLAVFVAAISMRGLTVDRTG